MTTPNPISEWPPERIAEVLERMGRRAKTIGTDQVSYILLERDLPSAVREIQRLRAEVAELRKDKKRLDWMSKSGCLEIECDIFDSYTLNDDQRDSGEEYESLRAAILRAEATEAQVKALLRALPAERAEAIANWGLRCICPDESCCSRCQGIIKALRAYAAAAKPKER